ncbi:DUF4142 domain-containing protein [Sphingobacterium sp. SRCM116780]|uniref:DUF4142 domain-containing protein n=1 Tax=Sphingobacterium sp. SRCM116780 TaxID=2907623 RepID=UPI001F470909|nr:DUF4142 domain-containing protein [Sphingobacterium sp. SRCM116780]UIR56840.1 DUF4142 domain-containing protein [Sphingobacterium sp. SRCM116780]
MKKFLIIGFIILGLISLQSFKPHQHDNFINKAIASNRFEIAISEQAMNKSQNKGVQDFSKMLVDDHHKLQSQLDAYATANNLTVENDMSREQQQLLTETANLNGAAYDERFKSEIIASHENIITLFESAIKSNMAKDDTKNTWLNQTISSLKNHLELAKSLNVTDKVDTPISDTISNKHVDDMPKKMKLK